MAGIFSFLPEYRRPSYDAVVDFYRVMPEPVRSLPILPQIVPSQNMRHVRGLLPISGAATASCGPILRLKKLRRAVARGVDESRFPHPDGCQIDVAPHPDGEGFLCPAFDPITSRCTIYEDRPLDCQLYPFALMWDAQRQHVVLGWDVKCPFMARRGFSGDYRCRRGSRRPSRIR